jgi:hypothetical protein
VTVQRRKGDVIRSPIQDQTAIPHDQDCFRREEVALEPIKIVQISDIRTQHMHHNDPHPEFGERRRDRHILDKLRERRIAAADIEQRVIMTLRNVKKPLLEPRLDILPGWDPKGQDHATCVGGLLAGANILCHTESPLWTRVTGMTACTVLSFCFLYRKISPPGFLGKVADKLLPIGSTLVGIGLIVDGFLEGDLTDWQKAENFLWRFPMACRVALYIPPNPYVKGAMIANDVACAAAAAAIHLTKG